MDIKNLDMNIIKLISILFLLTACTNKSHFNSTKSIQSEIDLLKTPLEIEKFIQKSSPEYSLYKLKNLQDFNRSHSNDSINKILANKLNVRTNFAKVDFDNNGYTDLFAIGDINDCISLDVESKEKESCSFSPIVIMNFGKNDLKFFRINLESRKSIVPRVEFVNDQPFLVVYQNNLIDWEKKKYDESKTILTFKFGGFIEYNENPKKNKVTKIEYSTSGCFGTCPVYELTLNRDSISIFNAQYYNFDKNQEFVYGVEEGVFTTSIHKNTFDKLEEILNYCDVVNLNNEYSVKHTDDQTGILKITFHDGKVKTISDYGMIGTYGLKILHKELAKLRFNQKWQKK